MARFFSRLSSFARLILFDRRGCGMSDHVSEPPALEDEVGDLIAVLDAVGCDHAAVLAYAGGGPLAVDLATRCPQRVSALVLYAASMRNTAAAGYEWALRSGTPAQLRGTSQQLGRRRPGRARGPQPPATVGSATDWGACSGSPSGLSCAPGVERLSRSV